MSQLPTEVIGSIVHLDLAFPLSLVIPIPLLFLGITSPNKLPAHKLVLVSFSIISLDSVSYIHFTSKGTFLSNARTLG